MLDLYINFFSWHKVPTPKTDDDPIPVCGSKLEINQNEALINLGFNPKITEKYGKNAANENEREMLINLGFQFVENQNECKITTNRFEIIESEHFGDINKCLAKLTNKIVSTDAHDTIIKFKDKDKTDIPESLYGKIASINLKSQTQNDNKFNKKNLIEEINKNDPKNMPNYEEKISDQKNDLKKATYEIKVNLVGVNSMNECNLDIDSDYLTLNTTNKIYSELKISLKDLKSKYDLETETIEAKFVKKTSILKIKIALSAK